MLTKELLRTAFNILRLAFVSLYDKERAAKYFYVYIKAMAESLETEVEGVKED